MVTGCPRTGCTRVGGRGAVVLGGLTRGLLVSG